MKKQILMLAVLGYSLLGCQAAPLTSQGGQFLAPVNADNPKSNGIVKTVNPDGTGDFTTIQAAVDSVSDRNTTPTLIKIAAGTYAERVFVPRGRNFLILQGAGKSRKDVLITGGADKNAVLKVSADDFRAENFTVENTAGQVGPQQALYGDGKRQIFENLLIKGWQDTLGSWNGHLAYFHNCEVWGSVDFVYSGGTAVFENCDLVQIRNTGGVYTAPSTPAEVPYGFVFLRCRFLKGPDVSAQPNTTLSRPWRADGAVAFIDCLMDNHISAKAWSEWDGREKTARSFEYGSKTLDGQPIDLSKRAPWVKVLNAEEAKQYTVTNVLGGWNPKQNRIVVAQDGSGDFKTIQEAIAAIPEKNAEPIVVHIKAGIYQGQKILPTGKNNVRFEGEDASKTILTWNINTNEEQPAGVVEHKGTAMVVMANDFQASNITFENAAGDRGQALALRIDGDRAIVRNCRLLGWQDTLMVNKNRQYFRDCYIEGRVDFIFGSGTTVFDNCEIKSKNGSYVTAASTPQEKPFGFVFLNCNLTESPAPWVDPATGQPPVGRKFGAQAYLGRPWRPDASVTFINCQMGNHILPVGWNNWGKETNEATARYSEWKSRQLDVVGAEGKVVKGAPVDVAKRAAWSKQLNDEEAAKFTIEGVFGDWNPAIQSQ